MKRIIIIAFLASYLISCHTRSINNEVKSEYNGRYFVDMDSESTPSLNFFFSEIEVIRLQQSVGSYLNYPFIKYKIFDSTLYFLDLRRHEILLFNLEGIFIKKINHLGNGPGEYNMICDFGINRFSQNLELLTPQGKLLIYDKTGEHFLEYINISEFVSAVHNFANLTNDIYVFYSEYAEKKILYYSKKSKSSVNSEYSLPSFIAYTHFNHYMTPFIMFSDTLRFYEAHNGMIHNFNPEKYIMEDFLQWDFGKYNFKLEKIPKNESESFYRNIASNIGMKYVTPFIHCVENDRFIIARTKFRNKFYTIIYDKKRKQNFAFNLLEEGVQINAEVELNGSFYSCIMLEDISLLLNNKIIGESRYINLLKNSREGDLFIIKYKI
jgi:hypothetical protein